MDVDGARGVRRPERIYRPLELRQRHRPQRVQRQPYAPAGVAVNIGAQGGYVSEKLLDGCHEAALAVGWRGACEVGRAIDDRHQRKPDAGQLRSGDHSPRHLHWVGVGDAFRRVAQIVELGDTRISVSQQLYLELRRDGLHVVRIEALQEIVHALPPSPERVASLRPLFRETCHGALKRVRVQIRHAGHGDPAHAFAGVRIAPGRHGVDESVGGDRYPNGGRPPVGKKNVGEEEVGHLRRSVDCR